MNELLALPREWLAATAEIASFMGESCAMCGDCVCFVSLARLCVRRAS